MNLQERIAEANRKSLASYETSRRAAAQRGLHVAEIGELFVLPATAEQSIEWAIIARQQEHLLVVPADTHPYAGQFDVSIPETADSGFLTLRCGFGVWTVEEHLRVRTVTGVLDPLYLERARRASEDAEQTVGTSVPPSAGDGDPDFREWHESVLLKAHTALVQEFAKPIEASEESPKTPAGRPSATPFFRVAASILLAATVALSGGLWRQQNTIEHLRDELGQAEQKLARELDLIETDRQRPPTPLVNVPFAWLSPFETTRSQSSIQVLSIPAGAPYALLILQPDELTQHTYRLEIRNRTTDRIVSSFDELDRTGVAELSVALPRDLLPPGDYRLVLSEVATKEATLPSLEFALRVEHDTDL